MNYPSNLVGELHRWVSAYETLQVLGEEGFRELSLDLQYKLFSDLPPPILFGQFLSLRTGVRDEDLGNKVRAEYDPRKEFFDENHKFISTDDQEQAYQEHLKEQKRRSMRVGFDRAPEYTEDGRSVKTLMGYAAFHHEVGTYESEFKRLLDYLKNSPNESLKYLTMRRAKDITPEAKFSADFPVSEGEK
jgi:hypothetical protein